jgi:3-keto-disaccharide hydrolase
MTAIRTIVATLIAMTLLAAADVNAESITAKVKDGWGKEVTVQGYNDAKLPGGEWFVHDPTRPQPKAVEPDPSPTLGKKPPEGAVVLFDGSDLSKWQNKKWKVENGYMVAEPNSGSQMSKEGFGSCQLHLEFATPTGETGTGQGRGNSGVLIMSRYEVQVLNSWHNATYPDGQCAAMYGQYPPTVNASRAPGEWQTYDITWHAPKFEGGKLVEPARVTVIHNGIKVQDNVELIGATVHRQLAKYSPHGPKEPLELQYHGHPVRYRNIWYVPSN